MNRKSPAAVFLTIACTFSLLGQSPPVMEGTPHDITQVDVAPIGGAIAVPLNRPQTRRFRKYDFADLAGSRQALGSQLIDGRLPNPLLDYFVISGKVQQRISFFEGGLTVLVMTGAGGTIKKKMIIPADALDRYLKPFRLLDLSRVDVTGPEPARQASVRIYDASGQPKTLAYDPLSSLPKPLHDGVHPLEDLLRAMSEDRTVTSTLAGYLPKVGDLLVADDSTTYRVQRLIDGGTMVELHCTSAPLISYIATKDLYNYFIGAQGGQQ